jgi:prepilin-type N-terminal cleavage/methylation domain-containing protein
MKKINNKYFLKAKSSKLKAGFTIIEMLVVIAIMALLTSLLILYSRSGENQVILFREQARLITALNRAKSLSVQLYNAPETPCGFGVHFSQNSFLIFRDLAPDCANASHTYNDPNELFEDYQLSPKIRFRSLDSAVTLSDIIFIPPDPKTIIDDDPNKAEAIVILETLDGNTSVEIKVNNAGQITNN